MEIERETNRKKNVPCLSFEPVYAIPANMIWNSIFFSALHPTFLSSFFSSSAHLPSVTLMAIYNQLFVKQNFNSKFIFSVELHWKRFVFFRIVAASVAVNLHHHRTDWHKWSCKLCRQMFYRFSKSITHNLYFHEVYVSIRLQIWQKITEGAISKDVKWKRKEKKKKNRTHINDVVAVQNFKISYTVHETRVSKDLRSNERSCNNAYDVR